jgi:hypothetical protein
MGKRIIFSKAALSNAAAVAKEKGVTISLEAPDGTVYKILPTGQDTTSDADLIDWRRK